MRIALFPGSFNPFTVGHKSIVDRAIPLFDRIIIAIGTNAEKSEADSDDLARRIRAIVSVYEDEPAVEVYAYEGLTSDFAAEMGAGYSSISSSVVRELQSYGVDVSDFLPEIENNRL